jgi:iron(III) transport system permease protein
MNAAFEEASRVAGAGGLRTALRITVPVMAPAILSVLLLGTMISLQTFEVEQVLGLPFRFFVFSTTIYDLLVTRVPRYDAATALSVLILAAMLPLVFAQQWLTRGRGYTTVTGQFQRRVHALGAWRRLRAAPLHAPGFSRIRDPPLTRIQQRQRELAAEPNWF